MILASLLAILVLLTFLVVIFIVVKFNKNNISNNNDVDLGNGNKNIDKLHSVNYSLRENLLSDAEYSFYKSLLLAAPQDVLIFCKVRISDVIYAKGKKNAGNRINQKHFDFVVCDKISVKPLFCIELDDKSHDSKDRKERDLLVDEVCRQSNFRISHAKAKYNYSVIELREFFSA